MPGFGYGINYEHGLFRQAIEDGHQREYADSWRATGSPWLIVRRDDALRIPVYGQIAKVADGDGLRSTRWTDLRVIVGVPHDLPIVGYGGRTVNTLRLYSARASDEFDIDIFNQGDYLRAFEQKLESERVSKVLYPPESTSAGKELRLLQEYFFVACALRDIVARYLATRRTLRHASRQGRDPAQRHAPGARGRGAHAAVRRRPRHAVREGLRARAAQLRLHQPHAAARGARALAQAAARARRAAPPADHRADQRAASSPRSRCAGPATSTACGASRSSRRVSPQHVRMAHLAIVGSHAVNGVSKLHSELVKTELVPDFAELWPGRFQNKTNGISPRRWLLKANPRLSPA